MARTRYPDSVLLNAVSAIRSASDMSVSDARALRALGLLVAGLLLSGCPDSRFDEPFYISTSTEVAVVTGPGRYILSAECGSDHQLMGGAYFMPSWDRHMEPAVLANYPSARDRWTVVFDVADSEFLSEVVGKPLIASAYCLTTTDYPLNSVIVSNSVTPQADATEVSVDIRCPEGSVVTGGGFSTSRASPVAATYNANLFVSAPTIGSDGRADGWQMAAHYALLEEPPSSQVYAICARQNLVAGPAVVSALDHTTLPYAWGWATSAAECPRNMFATGGGYSILGDMLIPRQAAATRTSSQFTGWQNDVAFGFQTPNYDFRPCDPASNPDCAKTSAFAACIEIPDFPFVSVEILSPNNGDSFGPTDANATSTAPISFVAEGFDENGDPLTGAALQWTIDGVPAGSVETISVPVSTVPDAVIPVKVRVTATGQSTSTYDQIQISVGVIH